jgi:8-oxo-dGTP pyrophosphatase MutT (NUDIX family)
MWRQVDRIYRLAYRMAYPVVSRWWRFYGRHHGVAVAVWSGDTVLAVRHSYKPGLRLPGGGLARRENPHRAAVRELREEVGVLIDPARLSFVTLVSTRVGLIHLYEARVEAMPDLVIDRREIIEARFVPPNQVHEAHFRNRIGAYLRHLS